MSARPVFHWSPASFIRDRDTKTASVPYISKNRCLNCIDGSYTTVEEARWCSEPDRRWLKLLHTHTPRDQLEYMERSMTEIWVDVYGWLSVVCMRPRSLPGSIQLFTQYSLPFNGDLSPVWRSPVSIVRPGYCCCCCSHHGRHHRAARRCKISVDWAMRTQIVFLTSQAMIRARL